MRVAGQFERRAVTVQSVYFAVVRRSLKGTSVMDKEQILLTEYTEVCKSYQAISDFRGKLLALLPIGRRDFFAD